MGPLTVVLALSAVFFIFFIGFSFFVYTKRSDVSGKHGAIFSSSSVGVVELNGVILDSKKTLDRLKQFEKRDDIKAVVLRLNSPGGSVAPSQEIYQAVKTYAKPLVVSMSSVAASGAYYIACGAKKVFANPGTITGSIGVIMEFANIEKLYEWLKIKRYAIKTGKFKDTGSEYREMTPEERELLQGMVDDVLGQFRQAVAEGRKIPKEKVVAISDGRIFSGNQAKELKLVDELGTLDDAVHEAARMAKITGEPGVVYPEKKQLRWLELLLNDNNDEDSRSESSLSGNLSHGVLGALAERVLGTDSTKGLAGLTDFPPGIYWIWKGAY